MSQKLAPDIKPPGNGPGGGPVATLLLSGGDVRRLVTVTDVIEAIEQAARERAAGQISVAPRVGLPDGGTLLMAAASAALGGVAGKIVSIAPSNRAAGLTTIQGLVMWFDYATRQPLLVADATAVTALRTGGLSGVATKTLALPGASVLAMIGAGGQALSQVASVAAIRPIEQVRVVSLHSSSAEMLCDQLSASLPGVRASVSHDVGAAVRGADIVCLATTATSALIEADGLKDGVHVNAVGAYRPDMREVGVSVFASASAVCADDAEGALREAGDLIDAVAAGALDPASLLDLGMLVDRVGAESAWHSGTTVFKSVGFAAADLALLDLLSRRARAQGAGLQINFAG